MADKYILQVTAGTSYDASTHKVVAVNTAEPLRLSSNHMDLKLNVRVQVRHKYFFLCISFHMGTLTKRYPVEI